MGIAYQYNGVGGLGSGKQTRHVDGSINGNIGATAAQDLRRQNGTPFNQAPHGVEFDGSITKLVISNATTNNYSIQILVNNVVVSSSTRNNGQNFQSFDLDIDVVEGDLLRLRFNGGVGSTQRPAAQLTYTEA